MFDHDCYVASVTNFAAGICGSRDGVIIAAGEGKAEAGHINFVKHLSQELGKYVKFYLRWRDQIELWRDRVSDVIGGWCIRHICLKATVRNLEDLYQGVALSPSGS
jgi:hypothetical protein